MGKDEELKRSELQWSEFVEKCYSECLRTNKSGRFYKNKKVYDCDKDYLYEYGNGIIRPEITPYDICPGEQKKLDMRIRREG